MRCAGETRVTGSISLEAEHVRQVSPPKSHSDPLCVCYGVMARRFMLRHAHADNPPEVQGLIVTGVSFAEDAREKLASAGFELLAGCTARKTSSQAEWQSARQTCHLHFKFVTPRTVTLVTSHNVEHGKVEVAEMIITFPLASGRVWVRSGDEYTWFAKWPSAGLYKPIQLLLSGNAERVICPTSKANAAVAELPPEIGRPRRWTTLENASAATDCAAGPAFFFSPGGGRKHLRNPTKLRKRWPAK